MVHFLASSYSAEARFFGPVRKNPTIWMKQADFSRLTISMKMMMRWSLPALSKVTETVILQSINASNMMLPTTMIFINSWQWMIDSHASCAYNRINRWPKSTNWNLLIYQKNKIQRIKPGRLHRSRRVRAIFLLFYAAGYSSCSL